MSKIKRKPPKIWCDACTYMGGAHVSTCIACASVHATLTHAHDRPFGPNMGTYVSITRTLARATHVLARALHVQSHVRITEKHQK